MLLRSQFTVKGWAGITVTVFRSVTALQLSVACG
jgi:hypothetical protein